MFRARPQDGRNRIPAPVPGAVNRNVPGYRGHSRRHFAAPVAEPAQRYGNKTEKKVRGFAILQIIRIFATPFMG